MTNGDKYKEVFGFEHPNCPTWHCPSCPVFNECSSIKLSLDATQECIQTWWNSEYKEKDDET